MDNLTWVFESYIDDRKKNECLPCEAVLKMLRKIEEIHYFRCH